MRNITAAVLLVAAAAVGLNGIRQAQGPKPDWPCIWPFCERVFGLTEQERDALNARNQVLVSADINRAHRAHVGGVPVD
jgi:hypothetical protein